MNAKTLIAGLITTIAAAGAFANEFNGEAFYQYPQASTLEREPRASEGRAGASPSGGPDRLWRSEL